MNKKRTSFLSIGIPSMCVIFSVLCLVILALLTLGTSRQDLQTSRLSLDQTTAYYTACSTATQQYSQISDFITSALTDSSEKKTIFPECHPYRKNFLISQTLHGRKILRSYPLQWHLRTLRQFMLKSVLHTLPVLPDPEKTLHRRF